MARFGLRFTALICMLIIAASAMYAASYDGLEIKAPIYLADPGDPGCC